MVGVYNCNCMSSQLVDNHEMPEMAAIELTDRQQQILEEKEVHGKKRKVIAKNYRRKDGDGTLTNRGVESHLRVARKKRQLAVNTLFYAEQLGAYEALNLDIPKPDEIDFPDYVTIPRQPVNHNDTCLFEQQKNILQTVSEHGTKNKGAVRSMLSEDEISNYTSRFRTEWEEDGSAELFSMLEDLVDCEASSFDELKELLKEEALQNPEFRQSLIEQIEDVTGMWSSLEQDSVSELIVKYAGAHRAYEKKYTTYRQYKYHRLPQKLNDCYRTAILPDN